MGAFPRVRDASLCLVTVNALLLFLFSIVLLLARADRYPLCESRIPGLCILEVTPRERATAHPASLALISLSIALVYV